MRELHGTGIWNLGFRFGPTEAAQEAAAVAETLGYTTLWFTDAGGEGLFKRVDALSRRPAR